MQPGPKLKAVVSGGKVSQRLSSNLPNDLHLGKHRCTTRKHKPWYGMRDVIDSPGRHWGEYYCCNSLWVEP